MFILRADLKGHAVIFPSEFSAKKKKHLNSRNARVEFRCFGVVLRSQVARLGVSLFHNQHLANGRKITGFETIKVEAA